MHISPCWLNSRTSCLVSHLLVITLFGDTHNHSHTSMVCNLFFILISSPQRECWSQEQCKLSKMFRKVAFPTGISQLQLRVCTPCVFAHVGVWTSIVLHVLEYMKSVFAGICKCVLWSLFSDAASGYTPGDFKAGTEKKGEEFVEETDNEEN